LSKFKIMKKVLLTGVSGFLGSHIAIQLLNKGYQVIGTLRDKKRIPSLQKALAPHTAHLDRLEFREADLLDAGAWDSLCQGVDFVQHVASPFPRLLPKNESELIRPAVDGTLNVLQAALRAGVKRTVLTSSTGAIMYGKTPQTTKAIYTEADWSNTDLGSDITPYFKSKTLAEQAAWDYVKQNPGEMELSVICPGAILGPVLEEDFGTSANIVIKSMDGSSPALPQIGYDMVDVRSVAELHILAMELPQAAGERFIGSAGYASFKEVAQILKPKYPKHPIPTRVLPGFMVKLVAMLDPTIKPILIDLGKERRVSHEKAERLLGWKPKSPEEAILSCAESLIRVGLIKKK
jgi:dihydroflavonol-4-reductase